MSTPSEPTSELDLASRFPESVVRDTRPGYTGWITTKDALLEIAASLRDEFHYDYLSSVTGVDYLPEGKMEVV